MNGVKIAYRTEFPRVGRVLLIGAETDKAAIVCVIDSSTGLVLRSKRFEDCNEAMNYYSWQFANLKSAEEFEVMSGMFEMLCCKSEGE